jgi:hypothetical protein
MSGWGFVFMVCVVIAMFTGDGVAMAFFGGLCVLDMMNERGFLK